MKGKRYGECKCVNDAARWTRADQIEFDYNNDKSGDAVFRKKGKCYCEGEMKGQLYLLAEDGHDMKKCVRECEKGTVALGGYKENPRICYPGSVVKHLPPKSQEPLQQGRCDAGQFEITLKPPACVSTATNLLLRNLGGGSHKVIPSEKTACAPGHGTIESLCMKKAYAEWMLSAHATPEMVV